MAARQRPRPSSQDVVLIVVCLPADLARSCVHGDCDRSRIAIRECHRQGGPEEAPWSSRNALALKRIRSRRFRVSKTLKLFKDSILLGKFDGLQGLGF